MQQKLWKKKYDFAKANKVIREVTKNNQEKQVKKPMPDNQQTTSSAEENCDKCGQDLEPNCKEVATPQTIAGNAKECSEITNSEKKIECCSENGSSPMQRNISSSSQDVKCDTPSSVVKNTEEIGTFSGAITDEGEIRMRPEEKKRVSNVPFYFVIKRK